MLRPYEISHGIHNTVGWIGVEDDVQTHTTGGPLKELGQEVNWNFQGPFIGVLSGCAKSMPMHLCCQLLPQVERQLLLLQQSRVNPGMSAYAHVYQGQHDYNKHPFVPIGMELLVHVKLHKQ
jgi:hypothetical protein